MPAKSKKDAEFEKNFEKNVEKYLESKFSSHKKSKKTSSNNSTGGALYFVGFVGSFIYWAQAAVGFMAVVTGFLKSLVWPAYIVFNLLQSFYGLV